jgi:predicted transcriptional regulator
LVLIYEGTSDTDEIYTANYLLSSLASVGTDACFLVAELGILALPPANARFCHHLLALCLADEDSCVENSCRSQYHTVVQGVAFAAATTKYHKLVCVWVSLGDQA